MAQGLRFSPRSTSLGRVIPAASFRLLSGTNNGAAGFCNHFNRLLLTHYLPVDFAPEPLLRLEIGGNSGATLSMYDFSLDPPRWPNGPQICSVINLPAFETEAELDKFNAANGPSCKVDRKWLCEHCEGWHCDVTAPDPSGGSSGTGRSSKRSKK